MSNDLIPSDRELQAMQLMAKNATQSKFFNTLNGESGILSIMLYAKELGLPLMQCLFGGMHNIQGKIELSSRLMNSMIRKAGHRIEIIESTDVKCVLKGTRKDTEETCTVSMTIEDAKRAGIVKSTGGWVNWPSDMLFARVISRLARRLFADVIGTAYVEGEISDQSSNKKDSRELIEIQGESEVEKSVPFTIREIQLISEDDARKIESMIGDDAEYSSRILGHYKIESFSKLPQSQLVLVMEKIKARNEQKLNDEMSNRLEA